MHNLESSDIWIFVQVDNVTMTYIDNIRHDYSPKDQYVGYYDSNSSCRQNIFSFFLEKLFRFSFTMKNLLFMWHKFEQCAWKAMLIALKCFCFITYFLFCVENMLFFISWKKKLEIFKVELFFNLSNHSSIQRNA